MTRSASRRFGKCVLHIGMEKTGTTSIQRFLTANRKGLAKQGILYPRSAAPRGGSQWEFVAYAHDRPWTHDFGRELGIASQEDQQRFAREFKRKLSSEFAHARPARTLLISSEHMQSRLQHVTHITRLKELLQPFTEQFEIVLYLRRQDRVSVSAYLQQIRIGQQNPVVFPTYGTSVLPYYYDYDRIYDTWASVFDAENIRLRIFSPDEWVDNDLISDFCAMCGIDASPLQRTEPVNESVTLQGAQFLGELSRQMAQPAGQPDKGERAALVGLISHLYRGHTHLVSRAQARAFYEAFIEGNERLRQKALADRPGPLFDDDFSSYPEQVSPPAEPSYSDAVDVSVEIWRYLNQKELRTRTRRVLGRIFNMIG